MSSVDFPTWFSAGCYGGLACCMCAIAINALYTTLRRRGTTRQLAGIIVICVISALLLLPALAWYNGRFGAEQGVLLTTEVEIVLAYVAIWGWLLPLSATITYTLFTEPRRDSAYLPSRQLATADNAHPIPLLPTPRQPDTPAPFVFGKDTPWGWLEHHAGRFQGLRLALTRSVVKLGREEDNDIWLDDDMASRYHAELLWNQGTVYVTDRNSLNGVLLNGRAIRGRAIVKHRDLLEIGSHQFLFEYAERPSTATEQDDPLLRHAPVTPIPLSGDLWSIARPLERDGSEPDEHTYLRLPHRSLSEPISEPGQVGQDTTPLPLPSRTHSIGGPVLLRLPSKPKKE